MSEKSLAPSRQREKTVPSFSLDRCKQCGICSHFCPVSAIAADAEGTPCLADPDACTSCRLCSNLCPDFAIEMVPLEGAACSIEDRSGSDDDTDLMIDLPPSMDRED